MTSIPMIYIVLIWIITGVLALFPVITAAYRTYPMRKQTSIRLLMYALVGVAFNQVLAIGLSLSAISRPVAADASLAVILLTAGHLGETVPLVLFALHMVGVFMPEASTPGLKMDTDTTDGAQG